MNYSKLYSSIVERARNRKLAGYSETHHIIPRCMGGDDSCENLVTLTPEEHFLCHLLLVKIYPSHTKLLFALNKMCRPRRGRPKRRLYGKLKRRFSEAMRRISAGEKNSQYGTFWITNGTEVVKIDSLSAIPEGWSRGRVLRPEGWNVKRPRRGRVGIASTLDASEVLKAYESGESTKSIALRYGWKSPKAVTVFLNSRFPGRKKYKPREKRSISSAWESTPLVSERSSVQT